MVKRRFLEFEYKLDDGRRNEVSDAAEEIESFYNTEILIYSLKCLEKPLVAINERSFKRI